MIISLKKGTKRREISEVVRKVEEEGLKSEVKAGKTKSIIHVIGDTAKKSEEPYYAFNCVEGVLRVTPRKYRRVSKNNQDDKYLVKVDNFYVGSGKLTLMIGPCALEGEEQIKDSVGLINKIKRTYVDNKPRSNIAGIVMRGGAFKPRTDPNSFQGMKKEGLKYFADMAHSYGIPIVTEVMDTRDVGLVATYADILQIGTRNAQNFNLIEEAGKTGKPVLLKRGMGNSLNEFLGAANYIAKSGNENIILCLRGVKGMQDEVYRFNPDLVDAIELSQRVRTPIAFDPSHSGGDKKYVSDLGRLAVMAGVDALLADVHPYPEIALVDPKQQLTPQMGRKFTKEMNFYKGAYLKGQKQFNKL
jgi:3-deoxy-7-phosphoheptulonate synthase